MGFWTRAAQLVRPVAGAHPVESHVSRPEPAWPSLPAIQRVVTPTAPVADREPFVASLRSHHNPSFLAPLAHLIDPDGPSGRIGGLVSPAVDVQQTAQPGFVQRWPQRFADGPELRSASEPALQRATPTAPDQTPPFTAEPAPVFAPESAPLFAPEPPPSFAPQASAPLSPTLSRASEPTAQRSAEDTQTAAVPDVEPGDNALRYLSAQNDPMPVQRSLTSGGVSEPIFRTLPPVPSAATEHATPQPPATSDEPPTAQREVPDAAPDIAIERVADPSPLAPRAAHKDSASRSPTDPETPVQRTIQLTSPHAPVPTLLDRTTAQPSPAARAHASQPASPTHVQRTSAPMPSTPAPSEPVVRTPIPTATAARSPASTEYVPSTAITSARSPLVGPTAQHTTPDHTAAQHTTAQRNMVASGPGVSTPLVSAPPTPVQLISSEAPMPQRASVQSTSMQRIGAPRHAKLGLGAPLDRTPPPTARIETVSLQEWAAARELPPAVQRTATTPEPTAEAPVARPESGSLTPVASTRPRVASDAAMTVAPTANTPVAQRLVGEPPQLAIQTVPVHDTTETQPGGTAPEPTAKPAPDQFGTPPVQRAVQSEPASTIRPGVSVQDAGSIAVAAGIAQRAADGSVTFDTPVPQASVVQRAVDTNEMNADTAAPQTAGAAPQPGPTATTAPAPGPVTSGTPNLDDLARRLYDPLAARLKAELRLDRERFGLVTDLYR